MNSFLSTGGVAAAWYLLVRPERAQIAAVRLPVSPGLTADDLRQADGRLDRLAVDEALRQQLTVEILRAALHWARYGQPLRDAA